MGAPGRPRGPDDLDDEHRARIRREVLERVRPLRRTFGDRVYDGLAVLALPAPHVVRGVVAVAVAMSIVGTATVASADAIPDEPLYGVKLASEQVRRALARAPEDRAAVELSMAEHRLAEAVRLVQEGRESDAVVVTSAYGTHLANAAAELATVERLNVAARPVVEQLKQRLTEQQHQASDMAARFVSDPRTSVGAQLFKTIASFAPALPGGATVSEGIAAHAADVAGQLAAVAERAAKASEAEALVDDEDGDEEDDEESAGGAADRAPSNAREAIRTPSAAAGGPLRTPPAPATARRSQPPRATATPQRTPPRATAPAVGAVRGPETARPTARPTATGKPKPTIDPKKAAEAQAARAAAEKAKREAEKARSAAERAKQAAKKTASPKPTPRR